MKRFKQFAEQKRNCGCGKDPCETYGNLPEEDNPRIPRKKGQPANSKKHSDLYTDENPKGTIHGLGFKDVETARKSVKKIENSGKKHAHKIQAAIAMEQRAREMGKTEEAAVYRQYINKMKKKTKEMNKEGLWDNIRKKRERIKRGSGERMRKKGEKGAPTQDQINRAKSEEYMEYHPKNNARYRKLTPNQ
tara:strand:- start:223 stop:795 length:573 start_codon:yes stop_codon:yes gene_type:complete